MNFGDRGVKSNQRGRERGRERGSDGGGEGGGGRGEEGLALRIANIFVVVIMNEKLNEYSESCRQENFSVLRSNIVGVTVRLFSHSFINIGKNNFRNNIF